MLLLIFSLGLFLTPARASANDMLGASALNLPLSVAQAAMGDTGLGGDDLLRAWVNPAVLAQQEGIGKVALAGGSLFGGLQTTSGGGVAYRIGENLTAGAMVSLYSIGMEEVNESGDPTGSEIKQSTMGLGICLALNMGWLAGGGTVRYVSESVDQDEASTATGDLGILAKWGGVAVAFAARNLGGVLRNESGFREILAMETRVAFSYTLIAARESGGRISGVFEGVFPRGQGAQSGFGWEWWPGQDNLAIRAGITGIGAQESLRMTGGIALAYGPLLVEYALATHAIGNASRASICYAFD